MVRGTCHFHIQKRRSRKSGQLSRHNNPYSCLGKLFTSLLKERLHAYLEDHNLLNKWQAGFRPGYRASDQTFILKTIVNKYLNYNKEKLYV